MPYCPKCGTPFPSPAVVKCNKCNLDFNFIVQQQTIVNFSHGIHRISNIVDFYPFAIHIIYGIILAQSYAFVGEIFLPAEEISRSDQLTNALGLVMIYVIIISGWVGYTKSIIDKPHKYDHYGSTRFIVELIITLLVFYLLELVSVKNFMTHYGEAFYVIIPIMFAFYLVWDILKYKEYSSSDASKDKILTRRLLRTLWAFIAILIMSLFYYLFSGTLTNEIKFDLNSLYIVFSVVTILITVTYRYVKWRDKERKFQFKV